MNNLKTYYNSIISNIESKYIKHNIPSIDIGDNIKLKIIIQEGNKERIQISEGIVISKHKKDLNTTITTRKTLHNIGVERVYLIHSPRIIEIQILKKAKVRRAKLYYLRQRFGKATRLKPKS